MDPPGLRRDKGNTKARKKQEQPYILANGDSFLVGEDSKCGGVDFRDIVSKQEGSLKE